MTERLWREVDADLYEVLALTPDASGDEVHRAWRAMAKRSHPDRGGDRTTFEAVHVAYLVLSDDDLRAAYDRERRTAAVAASVTGPDTPHSGWVAAKEAPEAPVEKWSSGADAPTEQKWMLWVFAIAGVVAVLGSYVWPWFTIITGFAVATVVLVRYHRWGFGLTRRR